MSATEIMSPDVLPPLLTADDLGRLLKVSKRTIWRMRSCSQLPRPVKVGGGVRWRAPDIETWIDQGCPAAATRDNRAKR